MPDSIRILPPGWRATDANDLPLSGAKLKFYDGGTSDSRTVYSDADLTVSVGSTITTDAGGLPSASGVPVLLYTGLTPYKIVITDADDVVIATFDDIPGALDTSGYSSDAGTPETPVTNTASNIVIDTTDQANLINVDCSGASRAVTLPNAVTVSDAWRVGVRHNGTANTVSVSTVSAQTINSIGYQGTTVILRGRGETMWFVSDGSGWTVDTHVPPLMVSGVSTLLIESRRTAPPITPSAGLRWIVSGTPTGTWSSYSQHDVLEYDGVGGYIQYVPATDCGWIAYVQDENFSYQYVDSAWVIWDNVTAPDPTPQKILIVEDQKTSGTDGGTLSDDTWEARDLNTVVKNTLTGASLDASTGRITLPGDATDPITYHIICEGAFSKTGATRQRLKSTTTSTEIVSLSMLLDGADNKSIVITSTGTITLAADEIFELQANVADGSSATAFGRPRGVAAEDEVYGRVTVLDITTLQGPAGIDGLVGEPITTAATSLTVSDKQDVTAANLSAATYTLASGLEWCVISRSKASTASVTVISADSPAQTIDGNADGVILNAVAGPVRFRVDPADSTNYITSVPALSAPTGTNQPWVGRNTVAELNALTGVETGTGGYASDGRKNGEGAAAGTGVQVFYDSSNWIAIDTGATVAA